jgi:hypothetical protein
VSERNRNPDPHPVLVRLASEDVVSLVGFVGPREPEGPVRLYADEDGQRYMDIPFEDFIDAEPVPYDERGRTRIYVKRDLMVANTFGDPQTQQMQVVQSLQDSIDGPTMSVWQFLPQNRLVAAEMLGMVPRDEWSGYEPETAS